MTKRKPTAPRARKQNQASSSGKKGLVAKSQARRQSAETESALDNRSPRTHRASAAGRAEAAAINLQRYLAAAEALTPRQQQATGRSPYTPVRWRMEVAEVPWGRSLGDHEAT
jgi:hypothetical protein